MSLLSRNKKPVGRQRRRQDDTPVNAVPAYDYSARRTPLDVELNRRTQAALQAVGASYWLRRFGLLVLLCVGVVSLVNVVVLKPTAKVLPLAGSNQTFLLHSREEYQQAADQILGSSMFNRLKLTADTNGLNRQLTAKFPELASVHTVLPLIGHRPIVYVEAASPSLLIRATNGDYVLDNRGKALLKASELPAGNDLHLPTVIDQSGLRVSLNHQIITPDNVSFIRTVVAELASAKYTVAAMNLPPAASELDVHLTSQPYLVKFNLHSNDARQQAGTYLATANYLKKHGTVPGEYIDVRVDGRAYYK